MNVRYEKYDAFIIHESATGKKLASDIKHGLSGFHITAFVAPEDIPSGVDELSLRLSTLKEVEEIFVIITEGLLLKFEESAKEVKTAVKNGQEERIRPYRKRGIPAIEAVKLLKKMGITTNKQCPEFDNGDDLIDDILKRKKRGELFNQHHRLRRIPKSKTTQRIVIRRLNADPEHEKEIAQALPGLYEVDQTFPDVDQYRLKLLQLALRQPDAFWVAYVNGKSVGYLSIYRMINQDLLKSLKMQAKQGILDLPDFGGELINSVDPRPQKEVPKSERMDFYIDALVVKKEYQGVGSTQIARRLIDKAKANFFAIEDRKNSVAVIAVNKASDNLIKNRLELEPYTKKAYQKTKSGRLYRHLFIWERTN
jgi:ribosomal protein S18 acetylase RimI-like enzyme